MPITLGNSNKRRSKKNFHSLKKENFSSTSHILHNKAKNINKPLKKSSSLKPYENYSSTQYKALKSQISTCIHTDKLYSLQNIPYLTSPNNIQKRFNVSKMRLPEPVKPRIPKTHGLVYDEFAQAQKIIDENAPLLLPWQSRKEEFRRRLKRKREQIERQLQFQDPFATPSQKKAQRQRHAEELLQLKQQMELTTQDDIYSLNSNDQTSGNDNGSGTEDSNSRNAAEQLAIQYETKSPKRQIIIDYKSPITIEQQHALQLGFGKPRNISNINAKLDSIRNDDDQFLFDLLQQIKQQEQEFEQHKHRHEDMYQKQRQDNIFKQYQKEKSDQVERIKNATSNQQTTAQSNTNIQDIIKKQQQKYRDDVVPIVSNATKHKESENEDHNSKEQHTSSGKRRRNKQETIVISSRKKQKNSSNLPDSFVPVLREVSPQTSFLQGKTKEFDNKMNQRRQMHLEMLEEQQKALATSKHELEQILENAQQKRKEMLELKRKMTPKERLIESHIITTTDEEPSKIDSPAIIDNNNQPSTIPQTQSFQQKKMSPAANFLSRTQTKQQEVSNSATLTSIPELDTPTIQTNTDISTIKTKKTESTALSPVDYLVPQNSPQHQLLAEIDQTSRQGQALIQRLKNDKKFFEEYKHLTPYDRYERYLLDKSTNRAIVNTSATNPHLLKKKQPLLISAPDLAKPINISVNPTPGEIAIEKLVQNLSTLKKRLWALEVATQAQVKLLRDGVYLTPQTERQIDKNIQQIEALRSELAEKAQTLQKRREMLLNTSNLTDYPLITHEERENPDVSPQTPVESFIDRFFTVPQISNINSPDPTSKFFLERVKPSRETHNKYRDNILSEIHALKRELNLSKEEHESRKELLRHEQSVLEVSLQQEKEYLELERDAYHNLAKYKSLGKEKFIEYKKKNYEKKVNPEYSTIPFSNITVPGLSNVPGMSWLVDLQNEIKTIKNNVQLEQLQNVQRDLPPDHPYRIKVEEKFIQSRAEQEHQERMLQKQREENELNLSRKSGLQVGKISPLTPKASKDANTSQDLPSDDDNSEAPHEITKLIKRYKILDQSRLPANEVAKERLSVLTKLIGLSPAASDEYKAYLQRDTAETMELYDDYNKYQLSKQKAAYEKQKFELMKEEEKGNKINENNFQKVAENTPKNENETTVADLELDKQGSTKDSEFSHLFRDISTNEPENLRPRTSAERLSFVLEQEEYQYNDLSNKKQSKELSMNFDDMISNGQTSLSLVEANKVLENRKTTDQQRLALFNPSSDDEKPSLTLYQKPLPSTINTTNENSPRLVLNDAQREHLQHSHFFSRYAYTSNHSSATLQAEGQSGHANFSELDNLMDVHHQIETHKPSPKQTKLREREPPQNKNNDYDQLIPTTSRDQTNDYNAETVVDKNEDEERDPNYIYTTLINQFGEEKVIKTKRNNQGVIDIHGKVTSPNSSSTQSSASVTVETTPLLTTRPKLQKPTIFDDLFNWHLDKSQKETLDQLDAIETFQASLRYNEDVLIKQLERNFDLDLSRYDLLTGLTKEEARLQQIEDMVQIKKLEYLYKKQYIREEMLRVRAADAHKREKLRFLEEKLKEIQDDEQKNQMVIDVFPENYYKHPDRAENTDTSDKSDTSVVGNADADNAEKSSNEEEDDFKLHIVTFGQADMLSTLQSDKKTTELSKSAEEQDDTPKEPDTKDEEIAPSDEDVKPDKALLQFEAQLELEARSLQFAQLDNLQQNVLDSNNNKHDTQNEPKKEQIKIDNFFNEIDNDDEQYTVNNEGAAEYVPLSSPAYKEHLSTVTQKGDRFSVRSDSIRLAESFLNQDDNTKDIETLDAQTNWLNNLKTAATFGEPGYMLEDYTPVDSFQAKYKIIDNLPNLDSEEEGSETEEKSSTTQSTTQKKPSPDISAVEELILMPKKQKKKGKKINDDKKNSSPWDQKDLKSFISDNPNDQEKIGEIHMLEKNSKAEEESVPHLASLFPSDQETISWETLRDLRKQRTEAKLKIEEDKVKDNFFQDRYNMLSKQQEKSTKKQYTEKALEKLASLTKITPEQQAKYLESFMPPMQRLWPEAYVLLRIQRTLNYRRQIVNNAHDTQLKDGTLLPSSNKDKTTEEKQLVDLSNTPLPTVHQIKLFSNNRYRRYNIKLDQQLENVLTSRNFQPILTGDPLLQRPTVTNGKVLSFNKFSKDAILQPLLRSKDDIKRMYNQQYGLAYAHQQMLFDVDDITFDENILIHKENRRRIRRRKLHNMRRGEADLYYALGLDPEEEISDDENDSDTHVYQPDGYSYLRRTYLLDIPPPSSIYNDGNDDNDDNGDVKQQSGGLFNINDVNVNALEIRLSPMEQRRKVIGDLQIMAFSQKYPEFRQHYHDMQLSRVTMDKTIALFPYIADVEYCFDDVIKHQRIEMLQQERLKLQFYMKQKEKELIWNSNNTNNNNNEDGTYQYGDNYDYLFSPIGQYLNERMNTSQLSSQQRLTTNSLFHQGNLHNISQSIQRIFSSKLSQQPHQPSTTQTASQSESESTSFISRIGNWFSSMVTASDDSKTTTQQATSPSDEYIPEAFLIDPSLHFQIENMMSDVSQRSLKFLNVKRLGEDDWGMDSSYNNDLATESVLERVQNRRRQSKEKKQTIESEKVQENIQKEENDKENPQEKQNDRKLVTQIQKEQNQPSSQQNDVETTHSASTDKKESPSIANDTQADTAASSTTTNTAYAAAVQGKVIVMSQTKLDDAKKQALVEKLQLLREQKKKQKSQSLSSTNKE